MTTTMETKQLAEIGVLGTLAESSEPLSLQAIQHRLRKNFERYWDYGQGVVSPAISRLRENDHIRHMHVDAESRYEITATGISRLQSLLDRSIEIDDLMTISQRHHVIIQFGFLHHLSQNDQAKLLTEIESQLREELDTWETLTKTKHEPDSEHYRWRGYRDDIIDLNKRLLEEHIEWIQTLSTYPSPPQPTERSQ
ncbi:MAG: hypothetical protein ABEH65_08960 [Halobacteriales archaeon]